MRKLATLMVCVVALMGTGAFYVASPLYTAWSIREAVKSDDTATLSKRVVWSPVRRTLKTSLVQFTLGDGTTAGAEQPRTASGGWWSKLKASYGRAVVERFVERYANPTGMRTLFTYGRSVRKNILFRTDPDAGLTLSQRLSAIWSRVLRAEFKSLTRFEIDMTDKFDPTRMYAGVLELSWRGGGWQLVELHVRRTGGVMPLKMADA